MWLAHILQRNRVTRPQAVALADGVRQFTWRELDERTDGIAAALERRGVVKGDRVLILSANRIEVIELYFAMAKAGVIACPLNPSFPLPEIEYLASKLRPVGAFAEQPLLDRVRRALDGWKVAIGEESYQDMAASTPGRAIDLPRPSDAAMIFSTSATTGRPKAVVVSHRSLMAAYVGMTAEGGMSKDDVMLNPCPLFHGSTVIGLAMLAAGGTIVIEREFTPQRFLADVARFAATHAFLVPSMMHFVLAAKAFDDADLSSLKEIMHGGGPISRELLGAASARLPCRLRNVYGITEGGGPVALLASDDPQPIEETSPHGVPAVPAVGRAMLGAQIAVLDEADKPLPPRSVGEICVRGDGVMEGYWEDQAASQQALANGWLHTSDLGYMDASGFVFLLDRKNDLIIRGGQNVYPAEIERVLREQPGVEDVAALGMPSKEWGDVPVAVVVASEGIRLNSLDLIATCTRELASYKRPVAIHMVNEIPRNAAGKILRRVLRERLVALDRNQESVAGRPS